MITEKGKLIIFGLQLYLGAFFLLLSRSYTPSLYLFIVVYLSLVYHILSWEKHRLYKLIGLSALTALCLSFRFKYLVWGDPWADYARVKTILEAGRFPLTDDQPLARILVVFVSNIFGVNPMAVQKFLIPALASLAVPVLYIFLSDFMPRKAAFYSALLLSVTTPFVHWISQGVRESLGLFISVLALYLSYEAVKTLKPSRLGSALLFATLVTLTHPRAALFFFISWLGFSLLYIMLEPSLKKSIYSAIITLFALTFSLRWWFITTSSAMAAINGFLSVYDLTLFNGYLMLCASILFLYLSSTVRRTGKILDFAVSKKKPIYILGLAIAIPSLAYVIIFLGGSFALPYPPTYYVNGSVMLLLAIVGFYYLLEKDKTPILGWALAVFAFIVINLLFKYPGELVEFGAYPTKDPFRLLEFASMPLAAIAGMGFLKLEKKLHYKGGKMIFSLFLALSLVAAFPSIVFLGKTFALGNVVYDERSWLISHPEEEIAGVNWLAESKVGRLVWTDRYVGYVLGSVGLLGITDRKLEARHEQYVMITGRMLQITDFTETILKPRKPISREKIQEVESKAGKIYSNGYSDIYLQA